MVAVTFPLFEFEFGRRLLISRKSIENQVTDKKEEEEEEKEEDLWIRHFQVG